MKFGPTRLTFQADPKPNMTSEHFDNLLVPRAVPASKEGR
jgi:hypothetical protein